MLEYFFCVIIEGRSTMTLNNNNGRHTYYKIGCLQAKLKLVVEIWVFLHVLWLCVMIFAPLSKSLPFFNEEKLDECLNISNLVKTRRHIDLGFAVLGLFISTVHLCILCYLKYWQRRKGFFLLLAQVIFAFKSIIDCFNFRPF